MCVCVSNEEAGVNADDLERAECDPHPLAAQFTREVGDAVQRQIDAGIPLGDAISGLVGIAVGLLVHELHYSAERVAGETGAIARAIIEFRGRKSMRVRQ